MQQAYSPIAPLFRVCDGVRIRFADNKADSSAVTVLMLSPWPESLWAFRRIWDRVSEAARVVAIDLPGFGHSDGRPELIAPDAMGTFLARLIEEWGLGAPHVVGPDVGTAAALFLAANAPDRVTSLTIGGGAVRDPIDAGGALKDVIEAPSLDDVRQLDARTNIGFAVEPAAGADSEPDVHEDYVSAYDLGRFAESARFVRHYPEQNPVLRDLLPSITTPAQIVAGREDDLVPWSNNEYLADLLPNSEIHPLDAGHFAWEQASDEYGRLIVEWVTGGFQRLGGPRLHLETSAAPGRSSKLRECRYRNRMPAALRWVIAGLLVWGLFTGIAYVMVPFLTDGWGNDLSAVGGLVLIGVCGALLLRIRSSRPLAKLVDRCVARCAVPRSATTSSESPAREILRGRCRRSTWSWCVEMSRLPNPIAAGVRR